MSVIAARLMNCISTVTQFFELKRDQCIYTGEKFATDIHLCEIDLLLEQLEKAGGLALAVEYTISDIQEASFTQAMKT